MKRKIEQENLCTKNYQYKHFEKSGNLTQIMVLKLKNPEILQHFINLHNILYYFCPTQADRRDLFSLLVQSKQRNIQIGCKGYLHNYYWDISKGRQFLKYCRCAYCLKTECDNYYILSNFTNKVDPNFKNHLYYVGEKCYSFFTSTILLSIYYKNYIILLCSSDNNPYLLKDIITYIGFIICSICL